MAKVLRPIGHDDHLSIVDHLDELRSRLIICGAVLVVAFGFCFWQNQALLKILNRALPASPKTSANHLSGLTSDSVQAAAGDAAAARALPQTTPQRLPITIGIGEPFTTTITVAFYFALLLSLPVLIYQAYAFVLPAFTPGERQLAIPLMLLAPLLFLIGVAFAYFVVLPPAVHFLQGYNSQNFDILVQAKTYYSFEMLTILGVGLAFQLPLALLLLQRLGVLSARTLTHQWRYAVVICAVIAAALPGVDPVTTALEMVPLLLLYALSIVMLRFADRRTAKRAAAELQQIDNGLDPT